MSEPSTWHIIEPAFAPQKHPMYETLFAQANGYLGLRGAFEEGLPGHSVEGTYINGFYESVPIIYGEKLYGFAENRQTILNLPNAKSVQLFLEDEPFDLLTGEILAYERRLDLQTGILTRQVHWRSPAGREVRLEVERMVLHPRLHLAQLRYTVTPLNFDGRVRLVSMIEGDVANHAGGGDDPRRGHGFGGRVLQPVTRLVEDMTAVLVMRTHNTGFSVACGIENVLFTDRPHTTFRRDEALRVGHEFTVKAKAGATITLYKYMAYFTSLEVEARQLLPATTWTLAEAVSAGYAALRAEQCAYMAEFWRHSDVQIEGDPHLQLGLRFNMFHLLQAAGKDGRRNCAAKGLTGEGYEGHFFWDTEIYVLPFFLYTTPEIARKLLEYRYHILNKARERARQMAHPRGALYPWRTIGGEECSPFFPAGTAQYHINADIALAIKRYFEATGDAAFMRDYGAEMLFETARLWRDVGHFSPARAGQFCIFDVTGPDEYTCVVDNNAYTNLLARENLRFAAQIAAWLQAESPETAAGLAAKIRLDAAEPAAWQEAANRMYIPYDAARGIIPQDDAFLSKPVWDFAGTPPEKHPLLLHYHPLVLYRHQVCKQADLVLAEFLLHEQFDLEQKRRDYEYYEPLTTHDSSLSESIFGIMAAELGYHDKAYTYFAHTAIMDLEDKKGNTKDGVHIANMAGAWQSIVFGFAGMRASAEGLSFKPMLPAQWQAYAFNVQYQGRLIAARVTESGITLRLLEGKPLDVQVNGAAVHLM